MTRAVIAYIPVSHLDLFWLGTHKTCLERGTALIRQYVDRCCSTPDETFLLETVVFAQEFLRRYPEYREQLVRLVHAGRVEVGGAYVDRWEHLTLGESLIRNTQLGLRWQQEVFGRHNLLVTHPDLPGLVPQAAQLYAQAGIKYYLTSRKLFEHGAVWRFRSPDGSTLTMLNYPRHYGFVPMRASDIPANLRSAWTYTLDLEQSLATFPLKTVPVAGGAGDLADRDTFRDRYGRYLEEFVAAYREQYPDITFTYTTPSQVLEAYDGLPDLPERSGEIPSVWGIGIGEEGCFFARDREVEGALLTAETAAAVAEHLGIGWLPPTSASWQGAFYDAAFFAPKDPIPADRAFRELWRMHVITHDHNAGGHEGVLSSFLKRAMQDRCRQYAREIIDHTLTQIADRGPIHGNCLVVFNPHGQDWTGSVAVTLPERQWPEGSQVLDEQGHALAAQCAEALGGQVTLSIAVPEVPSVGYRIFAIARAAEPQHSSSLRVGRRESEVWLRSDRLEVALDTRTGNLTRMLDLRRNVDWGGVAVGRASALLEVGNDVALNVDEGAPREEGLLEHVDDVESGPLFARLRVHKRLCRAELEQTVTLWADAPRVELQTRIFWWGAADLQLRLGLPGVPALEDIACGSPFYGSNWTDIVPDAAPRNRDEVRHEDYHQYKEIQGWMHLRGVRGGLTICTSHPAFHYGPAGLEAVLMRTPVSCGDARVHWQHAGESRYSFVFIPGEADWRAAEAAKLGALHLKAPVARVAVARGQGMMPAQRSFLRLGGAALLSSLSPATGAKGAVARVYDAAGFGGSLRLSGALADGAASAVDLLEEHPVPLDGQPGDWRLELPGWRIQTVLFTS